MSKRTHYYKDRNGRWWTCYRDNTRDGVVVKLKNINYQFIGIGRGESFDSAFHAAKVNLNFKLDGMKGKKCQPRDLFTCSTSTNPSSTPGTTSVAASTSKSDSSDTEKEEEPTSREWWDR